MNEMTPTRITALRESMGLSREQFAATLKTTAMTVYNWEEGKHTPSQIWRQQLERLEKKVAKEAAK